jgi:hypothetical protein
MAILFVLLGITFLVVGLRMIFSDDKFWWWSKSNPVVPTSVVFAAFPAALLLFLLAFIFYYQSYIPTEVKNNLVLFGGIPLLIISVALSIWQPLWLKPKWLRWLETHHGSVLALLQEEARKEEWSVWQNQVRTQEGLEEWVEEVRRKHHRHG